MTKLLNYQREGVDQIHAFGGRVLLADEPGLGKTIQALCYLMEAQTWPALVICPASLKLHWQREAQRHFGIEATVLYSRVRQSAKTLNGKLYIINYDILADWLPTLLKLGLKAVIPDECHLLGNPNALRSRAFSKVQRTAEALLALSGTPLTNNVFEMFTVLNALHPKIFDSAFAFAEEYCDMENNFGKWRFSGGKNLDKLHKRLKKRLMIRRLKSEVLSELPPMRRTVLPLEIQDRKEYDEAEDDLIGWLAKTDFAAAQRAAHAECYTRFTYLKQIAARLKMPLVFDWLDTYLEGSEGKMLVGFWHKSIGKELMDRYSRQAVVIDGSRTEQQRDQAEIAFNTQKKTRILFGQLKACGLGLNLPIAKSVHVIEFPWNGAVCHQFQLRAHRLTSKHSVDVFYLPAVATVEEDLCKIIEKKEKISDQVLDGVKTQATSLTIFSELRKAMKAKGKKR